MSISTIHTMLLKCKLINIALVSWFTPSLPLGIKAWHETNFQIQAANLIKLGQGKVEPISNRSQKQITDW